MRSAHAAGGELGDEVATLMRAGKLVPQALQLRLLLRAIESSRPPCVLTDFPRSDAQLEQLEAAGVISSGGER